MTELQIILIVCAVVFVSSLYWWGKKSKNESMQRPFRHDPLPAECPEDEGFEVVPLSKRAVDVSTPMVSTAAPVQQSLIPDMDDDLDIPSVVRHIEPMPVADDRSLESRMSHLDAPLNMSHVDSIDVNPHTEMAFENESQEVMSHQPQSQLFALLILSASAKFTRKQLHVAMEASRLNFHEDGTYVKQDGNGHIIFRVANVVEPGFFPSVDDESFVSPGVAIVLELPSTITPYRAMDEFITVARKVSQNLGAKLYDSQRHLIKESDLKAMREYAHSLTF